MASIFDVARYILEERGEISAMKLQKLTYYAQAWSLAWTEEPLFAEEFQAWRNGPVSPELYNQHKGHFKVAADMIPGCSDHLTSDQKDTILKVFDHYGNKSPQWLSDLTHAEKPWREVREQAGVTDGETCNEIITKAALLEYYSSL